jgi:acyl carrier protein
MLDIWENIFKRTVKSDSDFFDDLEGDSMAAAAIVHWIKIVYGVQVPMVEVFDQPTPAELTTFVDSLLGHETR